MSPRCIYLTKVKFDVISCNVNVVLSAKTKLKQFVFKINLITFKTLNGSGPCYLEDILKFYHRSRTLRSSRDHLRLEEPNFNMKTYGQRAFSVAAPRLWNKLPFEIRACSDVNLFKSKLKTFLFKKAYDI